MSRPPKKSTRKSTPASALKRLKAAFISQFGIGTKTADDLLAGAKVYDKAYELSCVIQLMKHLQGSSSGASFQLIGGSKLQFRSSGGEIQRGLWSYIEMHQDSAVIAEIWTDIECLALSAWQEGKSAGTPPYGRAHELDVVVVEPCTNGRPDPSQLFLGIEAKHRDFNKALLKELLGVRRETAFKTAPGSNMFAWWRADRKLPADPPSGIVLFCSSTSVFNYNDPAEYWGVEMIHHPF